jgi:hypothetical protein
MIKNCYMSNIYVANILKLRVEFCLPNFGVDHAHPIGTPLLEGRGYLTHIGGNEHGLFGCP